MCVRGGLCSRPLPKKEKKKKKQLKKLGHQLQTQPNGSNFQMMSAI